MGVDHVGSLLVEDVVEGVAGVPCYNQAHLLRENNCWEVHGLEM